MFVPDPETLKKSRSFTRKLAREMEARERALLKKHITKPLSNANIRAVVPKKKARAS